ncbi:MAG TPA: DOMON-like domain-containing protein [Caulobacter sp.]|nr:DOMON-like domain-containing protein [Caulobacter sp.]
MLLALTCHPDTPCDAVSRIEVNLARGGGASLALRYVTSGDVSRISLPGRAERGRADGLWKTTCFEAFVQIPGGYAEINLSPSDQWAAYGFAGYRDGAMAQLPGAALRHMTQRAGEGLYELVATLDLAGLDLPVDQPWRLGLSAVIEEASGRKSYWALAHGPDKPDFHHPDSFACVLEPS